MRVLLMGLCITFALFSDSKVVEEQNPLFGTWSIISSQITIVGGGKTQVFSPEHVRATSF
jgi:hypothetical protein